MVSGFKPPLIISVDGHFPEDAPASGENCPETGKIYYFFSFSMPQESIRLALEDSLRINRDCPGRAVLVLRGFPEGGLKSTIKEFYSLMKEEEKIEGDWPVTIDPPLFERHRIFEVPTIVLEDFQRTGKIKGDLRLRFALEKLEESFTDHGQYATTYPVKERDLRDLIASKQKEAEERTRARAEEIRGSAFSLTRYEERFTKAKEDRVYYVDPSVILSQDIKGPDGAVLFPRGSRFNPSDYLSLGSYVIIDGRDEKQMEFALQGDYKKIILTGGDLIDLARKYHRRFYFVSEAIIDRLRIEKVPAVVEQEGGLVRVTEKKMD